MGTEVQSKGYLPGYYSMRDLNEDSNSCSWPPYYGDQKLSNGQYYNGFLPRAVSEACDKDVLKQTMLEHEAIFKNQVHELHRLYRIQRDLMDEAKRKEFHNSRICIESSLSSRTLASQMPHEGVQRWLNPSFPSASTMDPRSSVSGADADLSALNSVMEKNAKGSPFQSQNGGGSRNSDVLESRPTKVRRKLLDLQLPADEYIDTEEGELNQENVSVKSAYHQGNSPESGRKPFYENGGKSGGQVNALRSGLPTKRTDCLADLNEPVQVEETDDSTIGGPVGNGSFGGEVLVKDLSTKPNSHYLGFTKEVDSGPASHMLEAGHRGNILRSTSQGHQSEKMHVSLQSMQHLLGKGHELHGHISTDEKVDMWRGRSVSGFDYSKEERKISTETHSASRTSNLPSQVPSPYSVGQSSVLAKSWSNGISSWEKLGGERSPKTSTFPSHPCFNTSTYSFGMSSQPAVQSDEVFKDRWNFNRSNQSDFHNKNGFYLGSSSGSKKPLTNIPYLRGSSDINAGNDDVISHGLKKVYNGLHCLDSKSGKGLNLNAEPQVNSDENIPLRSLEITDLERKREDHPAALPWLRGKPACKQEEDGVGRDFKSRLLSYTNTSLNHSWNKSEREKGPVHYCVADIQSTSSANTVEVKSNGTSDCPRTQKILGVPIFEKSQGFKNEPLQQPSDSENLGDNRKNRLFDINLPCEALADVDMQQQTEEKKCVKKEGDAEVFSFRHNIDLNSCASEDDNSSIMPIQKPNKKVIVEIDLEVPAVPESEEEDIVLREESADKQHEAPPTSAEQRSVPLLDELVKVAAEAIVSISSADPDIQIDDKTWDPLQTLMTDPLRWFVEVASSCGDDIDSKFDAVVRGKGSEAHSDSSLEEDYFESMTLKLTEVTEEEYMPKPLVPENIKLEETGASVLTKRPRRGQARRGRQRKDFQRDILPGLVSLSRPEVAEDLQTFGGLMRAMGHSWQSRLARRNSSRNGCARGRRRLQESPPPAQATNAACAPLIQQLNCIEERSLAGWGKTTRRPRRQRCPAGNPPSLPVT